MIRTNRAIPRLFDCFWFLGEKVRKQLCGTWAETFRRYIFPKLPVKELSQKYREDFGRPSKNLHTGLGLLVLQQMHDTTDEETLQRLAYDLRWQYALQVEETTDEELYMCGRTLWGLRQKAMELGLDEKLFAVASDGLLAAGGVEVGPQRMDSVHVKSNMKRLGRLRLMGRVIQVFLKNMRRRDAGRYGQVGEEIRQRYLGLKRGEEIFSQVKPSETGETLAMAAQNLCDLVEQFSGVEEVERMHSYQIMRRVLGEQCWVVEEEGGGKEVAVKAAKEVGGDSLQNPSDEEAGYSGHKGQGYTMQVMENFTKEEVATTPRLITYVEVTSAAVTDHHAVEPALEAVGKREVRPQVLLADSLYGSDENMAKARTLGVELVSPVNSQEKSGRMPLSAFGVDEENVIVECPGGQAPQRVKREKELVTVWFDRKVCEGCSQKEKCPVFWSKKRTRLPYELKAMRSSRRRQAEKGPEFRERYRWRSGIESSFSEMDRRTGVKHLRVRGMKAVRFSVFLKALGLNILRFTAWLAGGEVRSVVGLEKGISKGITALVKAIFSNYFGGGGWWKGFSEGTRPIKFPVLAEVAGFWNEKIECLFLCDDFLQGHHIIGNPRSNGLGLEPQDPRFRKGETS